MLHTALSKVVCSVRGLLSEEELWVLLFLTSALAGLKNLRLLNDELQPALENVRQWAKGNSLTRGKRANCLYLCVIMCDKRKKTPFVTAGNCALRNLCTSLEAGLCTIQIKMKIIPEPFFLTNKEQRKETSFLDAQD
jgi:hypothetical protein